MKGYFSGYYKLKNPKKYKGNPTTIIYRSRPELSLMIKFDDDPNVIKWSSEEIIVKYKSPIDNRYHAYFVDFLVTYKNKKTFLIEYKPEKFTKPPKKKKKITKTYLSEIKNWGVNSSKWKAANTFAEKKGWEFIILTENGIKKCHLLS